MTIQPDHYRKAGAVAINPAEVRPGSRFMEVGLLLILLMLSLFGKLIAPQQFDGSFVAWGVALIVGGLSVHMAYELGKNRHRNWLGADTAFIVGFVGSVVLVPVFYLFGVIMPSDDIWFQPSVVPEGMMVLAIAPLAFLIGVNVQTEQNRTSRPEMEIDPLLLRRWLRAGRLIVYVGFGSLLLTLVLLDPAQLYGAYRGMHDWQMGEKRSLLAAGYLLSTGFTLATIAAGLLTGKWKIGIVPKAILIISVLWALVMGDRSFAVRLVLPIAIAYGEFARRIKLRWLVVAVVAGVFVLGVVQTARNLRQRSLAGVAAVAREHVTEDWVESGVIFQGAASSAIKNHFVAVAMFPRPYSYQYGVGHGAAVMHILPLHSYVRPASWARASSAHWFTYILTDGTMDVGQGTCLTGDLYLNYGWIGVLIIPFAFGVVGRSVQQKARSKKTLGWGLVHVYVVQSLVLIARYPPEVIYRGITWPLVLYLITKWMLRLDGDPRARYDGVEEWRAETRSVINEV